MVTIPRYQPRSGPRLSGLDYAGAYSPPDGSDWRLLSQAAKAGATIAENVGALFPNQDGAERQAPEAKPSRTEAIAGRTREAAWRRQRLESDNSGGASAVTRSRQAAGEGLTAGAKAVFDALTASREAGFAIDADAREAAALRAAEQALSEDRQAIGLDEFFLLSDSAPQQADAALGSAARELAQRLRGSGLDEAEVVSAQKALVSGAHVERIGRVLADDVTRARTLLEASGALSEADRARVTQDIEAEERRLAVRRETAGQAARLADLANDPQPLLQWASEAGGADAELAGLYLGAATGEIRAARARQAARDEAAWAAVEPLLANGQVRVWTDLPARLWRTLSPGLQAEVQRLIEQPWRDADAEGGDGLLHRTDFVMGLPAYPVFPDFGKRRRQAPAPAPAPPPISRQTAALHRFLSNTAPQGHWRVHPETGHFFRWNYQDGSAPEIVYATPEEAQREVERRLGVTAQPPGVRSSKEARLRKYDKELAYFSDTVGSTWPTLKIPTDVNWDFVAFEESGSPDPRLAVYHPGDKDSGATVAHGFDLGVRDAAGLRGLGLPPGLERKLAPYLGMKGTRAKAFVAAHPLTLTRAEADTIDQAVRNREMGNLVPAFDAASKIGPFRSLPPNTQTAIASVYYNLGTDKLPGQTPLFWTQITTGDWEGAYANLATTPWDNPDRRKREAALIRKDIDNPHPWRQLFSPTP
jgi:hypothetical protein